MAQTCTIIQKPKCSFPAVVIRQQSACVHRIPMLRCTERPSSSHPCTKTGIIAIYQSLNRSPPTVQLRLCLKEWQHYITVQVEQLVLDESRKLVKPKATSPCSSSVSSMGGNHVTVPNMSTVQGINVGKTTLLSHPRSPQFFYCLLLSHVIGLSSPGVFTLTYNESLSSWRGFFQLSDAILARHARDWTRGGLAFTAWAALLSYGSLLDS